MQRIILYYKFTPVKDPVSVRLWQERLADSLGLKGRIIIAGHGINGTLGGELKDLRSYTKQTKAYPGFKDMVFKWSDGHKDDFPRLNVKVRPEIVTFGVADQIKVTKNGLKTGGKHIKPKQLHQMIKTKDVVLFDGRNAYEAAIGKFKNAVVTGVKHTRDFPAELSKAKYDEIKDKPVVTYCTGGIRCEVLTMLMKQRGFKDVYQLDGGIVKYGEAYGDEGLWEGKLHVFDARLKTGFSSKAKDIGKCSDCARSTSHYANCAKVSCNRLVLICEDCLSRDIKLCSDCTSPKRSIISSSD